MKLLLAACANSLSIDFRTNTLSLFNLVEEVRPNTFPALVPLWTYVAYFSREPNEPDPSNLRLIIALDKRVLADGPFGLSFQGRSRARGIADIGGLVIPTPGTLRFILTKGKRRLAIWPIEVIGDSKPSIKQGPVASTSRVASPRRTRMRSKARK